MISDAERNQILATLKDFSSIAKIGTLNNLFLTTFAELVDKKQQQTVSLQETMHQLDVLIAILEKVRLKRENYISLMQHVKVFVDDRVTQKKGYKILSKVIERFELGDLDEIAEIKERILPMMKGSANKERITLISSFINAMRQVPRQAGDQAQLAKTIELMRSFVIELIGCFNNSNQKIRTGAQETFLALAQILSDFKAIP